MESDVLKVAVAGGIVILTAMLALWAGDPRPATRRVAASPGLPSSRIPAAAPAAGGGRPRILTGEPTIPEQPKPVPMRALRLVGGITTLAVVAALGLIVVVRAVIAMFEQIGG